MMAANWTAEVGVPEDRATGSWSQVGGLSGRSPPLLSPSLLAAIERDVRAAAPDEACGFVMPDGWRAVANVHPEPRWHFRIAAADYLAAGTALALVHSHVVEDAFDRRRYPSGHFPHCPTLRDMQGQLDTALPWGIVVSDGAHVAPPFFWGDFILDEPLLGRPFRHGVDDCYSAIRKWYWQERRILLPEFPRAPEWWFGTEELYLDGYAAAGFRRLGVDEAPALGDVGLTRFGGREVKVINHGFVYLGDGTVYHHLPGRLARRDAAGGSLRQVTHWLRFAG